MADEHTNQSAWDEALYDTGDSSSGALNDQLEDRDSEHLQEDLASEDAPSGFREHLGDEDSMMDSDIDSDSDFDTSSSERMEDRYIERDEL